MAGRSTPKEFLDSIHSAMIGRQPITQGYVDDALVSRIPTGYGVALLGAVEVTLGPTDGLAVGGEVVVGRVWDSTGKSLDIASAALVFEAGRVNKGLNGSGELELHFYRGNIPNFLGTSFQAEYAYNPNQETNLAIGIGVNAPKRFGYNLAATYKSLFAKGPHNHNRIIRFMEAQPPGFGFFGLFGNDNRTGSFEVSYTAPIQRFFDMAGDTWQSMKQKAQPRDSATPGSIAPGIYGDGALKAAAS